MGLGQNWLTAFAFMTTQHEFTRHEASFIVAPAFPQMVTEATPHLPYIAKTTVQGDKTNNITVTRTSGPWLQPLKTDENGVNLLSLKVLEKHHLYQNSVQLHKYCATQSGGKG